MTCMKFKIHTIIAGIMTETVSWLIIMEEIDIIFYHFVRFFESFPADQECTNLRQDLFLTQTDYSSLINETIITLYIMRRL